MNNNYNNNNNNNNNNDNKNKNRKSNISFTDLIFNGIIITKTTTTTTTTITTTTFLGCDSIELNLIRIRNRILFLYVSYFSGSGIDITV